MKVLGREKHLRAPHGNLSPRSARKQIEIVTKKKKFKGKRKGRKYKKIKKISIADNEAIEEENLLKEKDRLLKEELSKLDPKKAPTKQDSSFYPPPSNIEKRRCYFHKGARALKCTVCSGGKVEQHAGSGHADHVSFLISVHFRTRRTFKSNLRILSNINMTFVNSLVCSSAY